MKNYLIIGNGAAGTTAAEAIRKRDGKGKITLVSGEDLPFYSRIRLPEYAAGTIPEKDLVLKKRQWHIDNGIELITSTTITSIDYTNKIAQGDHESTFNYDRLLIATGSNAFIPPVAGSDKERVFALRSVADARAILKLKSDIRRLVLIGGGLLGLEAGAQLIKGGMKIVVVEFFDRLLPRQLDYEGAGRLTALMEAMGFEFRLGVATQAILGGKTVQGVDLESGEILDADAVLFAAGVRSEFSLTEDSGIKTDRGIVVNSKMETTLNGVYAAGDAAQFGDINYCIWPEAVEQGRIAGSNMAGGDEAYTSLPPANKLKVAGIALASAGEIDPENKFKSEVTSGESVYKKIVKDETGVPIGCIMLGDTKEFNAVVKTIKGD